MLTSLIKNVNKHSLAHCGSTRNKEKERLFFHCVLVCPWLSITCKSTGVPLSFCQPSITTWRRVSGVGLTLRDFILLSDELQGERCSCLQCGFPAEPAVLPRVGGSYLANVELIAPRGGRTEKGQPSTIIHQQAL